MLGMGQVISLAERRALAGSAISPPADVAWSGDVGPETDRSWIEDEPFPGSVGSERFEDRRALGELEAAFARLESLAVGEKGSVRVPLDRHAETELLAVIGELALGYVPEAARRLERLGARIARLRPVRRTAGG
jgi:hypothetical protein